MDSSKQSKRYLDKSFSRHKFQPEKYAPSTKCGIPQSKKKQYCQKCETNKDRFGSQHDRLRNMQKHIWDLRVENEQAMAVKAQNEVDVCSRELEKLSWNPWSAWVKEWPKPEVNGPSKSRDMETPLNL